MSASPVKPGALAISLAMHAAALGVLWLSCRAMPDSIACNEPIAFELVEESRKSGASSVEPEKPMPEPETPEIVEETLAVEPEKPEIAPEKPEVEPETPPVEPETLAVEKEQAPPSADEMAEAAEPPPAESASADALPGAAGELNEERSRVVSQPRVVGHIEPKYPRSARLRNHQGSVVVAFSVNEQGKVSAAEVVSSSGFGELDKAALDSAYKAVFAPALEDGVPVASSIRLTFEFVLK